MPSRLRNIDLGAGVMITWMALLFAIVLARACRNKAE